MGWEFETVAGPFNPRLTEGPAWDGTTLLFTHIPASHILRYDPATGACTVYRENTNHTNGLAFDAKWHDNLTIRTGDRVGALNRGAALILAGPMGRLIGSDDAGARGIAQCDLDSGER